MQNNIKKLINISALGFLGLVFPLSSFAICPVCAIAVGAGVGFSRWMGVDDTITGVWIGAFIASLIGWTINWLNKINIRFYGRKILVTLLYYVFLIVPLYYWQMIGDPANKICCLDKLVFGIIVGTLAFIVSVIGFNYLKKHNNGQTYFRGQKIILPVAVLLICSLVLYFITK